MHFSGNSLLTSISLYLIIFSISDASNAQTLQLTSLRNLAQQKAHVVIVNGQAADPEDYPVSFQHGEKGKICTWFMPSAQAIIGAAHCVVRGTKKDPLHDLAIIEDNITYSATCSISPSYWNDRSADWAICKVSPPYSIPVSSKTRVFGFEVISSKPERMVEDAVIEIGGFGCTAEGGVVVDRYRIGVAKIDQLPPDVDVIGSFSPTPNTIKIRQSPSLLCAGDSGGPAFLYQKKGRVHRVVIGVNSSTAIKAGVSYLSSTSTETALEFFGNWAAKNKVELCGLSATASKCRPFLP